MSACVESMAFVGEVPWHGLGTKVDHAMNSDEALHAAALDWDVTSEPVFVNGQEVDNYRANVRSSDGSIFGIVTERYKIVQNRDAFSFTDYLLKNDLGIPVTYETAGALDGGRRVWLLAHLPPERVLGDEIVPYLVFTNSHDGKGSIRIAVTPTRVVCANTLQIAMQSAKRVWSTRHIGDINTKMKEAEETLLRTQAYMKGLSDQASTLQAIKVGPKLIEEFLEQVFPVSKLASDRQIANNDLVKQLVLDIYSSKPDLQNFKGTGWGIYNALADYESHSMPLRSTRTFKEKRFSNFIDGNSRLEAAEKVLLEM